MDTYLWPEILIDFFKRRPPEDEELKYPEKKQDWLSLLTFLRNGTNLFLNIDLEKTDYLEQTNLSIVLAQLTFGREEEKLITSPSKFSIFETKAFQNELPNIRSLIGFNELHNAAEIKALNGFWLWEKADYYKLWEDLKKVESRNQRGITVGPNDEIRKWQDLDFIKHPCTDIVISDRYILKNKDDGLFSLRGILTNIFDIKEQKPRLLIITRNDHVYIKNIDTVYNDIKNYLSANHIKLDLGILIDQSCVLEHDRKIYSNYFYIDSGDSWTYFKPNGNFKTKGTKITIYPLFGKSGFNIMQQSLREAKKLLDNPNSLKMGVTNGNKIFDFLY